MVARTLCLVLGLLIAVQPAITAPVAHGAPIGAESGPTAPLPPNDSARTSERMRLAPEEMPPLETIASAGLADPGALATPTVDAASTVVMGAYHTCAITRSGGLRCWGYNDRGQLGDGSMISRSTPADVQGLTTGITAVGVGRYHSCAITTVGGAKCWGNNSSGQLGDGTTIWQLHPVEVVGLGVTVAAVTVGHYHTCALTTAGGVKCWGSNGIGQLGDGTTTHRTTPVDVVGLGSGVIAVSAGYNHTCALTSAGAVKCWGANGNGQLGDGSTTSSTAPVDVIDLSTGVTDIDAGDWHTCAVASSGGAKCWGSNSGGKLGGGTTTKSTTPVDVVGLTSGVREISAGGSHTCALTDADGVKCWGLNDNRQLGNGTRAWSLTPADVVGLTDGVAGVDVGGEHTCAVTNLGNVQCWGLNSEGQLGDGAILHRSTPVDVTGLSSGLAAISAGEAHTCAVTGAGGAMCWGRNENGQLGDGTTDDRALPGEVATLTSGVAAIAAGRWSHTTALTTSGGVKYWGSNGDTTPGDVYSLGSGVAAITGGINQKCVLTSGGGVKCWGGNPYGELGDGTTTFRSLPVDVVDLTSGAAAVTAGGYHTCALTTGGGVKCWGMNYDAGQLGDGTYTDRLTPVDVLGLSSGVKAVSGGVYHTCALTNGGGVKCWGRYYDTSYGPAPVDVPGLESGVAAIGGGEYHTCVLTTAGGVKCWGHNAYGQLGDGTTASRSEPTNVPGLTSGVTAISAGNLHTCALTVGGGAKCWGSTSDGQLGEGTTTVRTAPVNVIGFDQPLLLVNHVTGKPGSYFTFTGADFPAGGVATVTVNGRTLTTSLAADGSGNVTFLLNTAGADPGRYVVTVSVNPSASASFLLAEGEPLRPQEGSGPMFDVPAGIGLDNVVYLPVVVR